MCTISAFAADCDMKALRGCWRQFLEPLGYAFDNDGDAEATCGSVYASSNPLKNKTYPKEVIQSPIDNMLAVCAIINYLRVDIKC